jgi:hypothetical protein
MRGFHRLIPVVAVPLLAAAAWALNASATLLPGDRLLGNIVTAGEQDALSLYLPGGSVLAVDALAAEGSGILPALSLLDPADAALDLVPYSTPGPRGVGVRVRGFPVPPAGGGVHDFLVTAGGATSGKYAFRCAALVPKRFAATATVDAAAFATLVFDAPAGSRLRFAMKAEGGGALGAPGLVDPAAATTPLAGLRGGGVVLGQDGTWQLQVRNDGAAPAAITVTATLRIPRSRRVLYLSTAGFGPAPVLKALTPAEALDDRALPGMQIRGREFDPAAALRLEKPGQAPLLPTAYAVTDPEHIAADFDFTGAAPGAWRVVVENPSGGIGRKGFVVVSAADLKLPPGVVPGTEVWWLDFDRQAFRADLREAGLDSPTSVDVSRQAEAAVRASALRWLRVAFDLDPGTGATAAGSVPVSFVLAQPPAVTGAPGAGYDRLAVGGRPAAGAPSSNPNYAWGDGPLDAGNLAYDDVSPAPGLEGLGVRSRLLASGPAACTPAFAEALRPLRDRPLDVPDGRFFLPDFTVQGSADALRYAEVVGAVDAAGRELAGTMAHFVARAMGTADGTTGLAATPLLVGEFAGLADFGFATAETDAMVLAARPGLPGVSKVLEAPTFPYVETLDVLLPDATTTEPYARSFAIAGGRPERLPADLEFTVVEGALPPGLVLGVDGTVAGTPPLRDPDGTLAGGVYRFVVRLEDLPAGTAITFRHRINLLVDTADPTLTPLEAAIGTQMNATTLSEP